MDYERFEWLVKCAFETMCVDVDNHNRGLIESDLGEFTDILIESLEKHKLI